MTTNALKHVNEKLKNLPDSLVEEVENYIDFLTFKHNQDSAEILQWQKDVVLKRIAESKNPVDAFEMIDNLDD